MNFTREPIIETVITPREGCKLVIRSSKGVAQEEYSVDAIEVVSFGHSFFFRSQERPTSFLVPISDYEVLELKETRMVLKNVSAERSIKIGGGREAPPRPREEALQDPTLTESRPAPQPEPRSGKRDNKRRRGRRGQGGRHDMRDQPQQRAEPPRDTPPDNHRHPEDLTPEPSNDIPQPEEEVKSPSFISKLFPPPPNLINRESLNRYKTAEPEGKASSEENIFEHPTDKELEDDSEE